ncbi:hypothetical protein BKA62DRAFT_509255 [Auriculariales sp. MPI-PUGE-AT-0066]|nr:hypothetical protein BKA62DRAFT_509255 [Auriculariales sp. MPI-PUGE-AT-0066]
MPNEWSETASPSTPIASRYDGFASLVRCCPNLTTLSIWFHSAIDMDIYLLALDSSGLQSFRNLRIKGYTRSNSSGRAQANWADLFNCTENMPTREAWTSRIQHISLEGFLLRSEPAGPSSLKLTALQKMSVIDCDFSCMWLSVTLDQTPALIDLELREYNMKDGHALDSVISRSRYGRQLMQMSVFEIAAVRPVHELEQMSFLSVLRYLAIDAYRMELIQEFPPQLQTLDLVFRRRSPRSTIKLIRDVIAVHHAVTKLHSGYRTLKALIIRDYVSNTMYDGWIIVAALLHGPLKLHGVSTSIHLVKIPFNESMLSLMPRKAAAGQRRQVCVQDWMERQGFLYT